MSLLSRNQQNQRVEIAPPEPGRRLRSKPMDVHDPLSPQFVVPPGIKSTAWSLVRYYQTCMYQRGWSPPNPLQAYLRPAKVLLDTEGLEMAVRVITHGIAVANHPPSFYFFIREPANGKSSIRDQIIQGLG